MRKVSLDAKCTYPAEFIPLLQRKKAHKTMRKLEYFEHFIHVIFLELCKIIAIQAI